MLICIDSCVFIRGINQEQSDAHHLLKLIGPKLHVVIHRIVAREVARNLGGREKARVFYSIFHQSAVAYIVDGPIPEPLVDQYITRGLPEKGDAIIGAFAEWMQVAYLISDNRHFLQRLQTTAYQVATPKRFLQDWEALSER